MGGVELKYAQVEHERRFLVGRVPDLSGARRVLEIADRYVVGTRLRLRTVQEDGAEVVHKLGHKVRFEPSSGAELAHTSLYLDESERALLAGLPAYDLAKTRHVLPLDRYVEVAVDTFHGALAGLVLAEVDLGHGHHLPAELPAWFGREVTDDDRFTGGALAALGPDDARALVASVSPR